MAKLWNCRYIPFFLNSDQMALIWLQKLNFKGIVSILTWNTAIIYKQLNCIIFIICILSCKERCSETRRCEQSCFWQGIKGVVLHKHWDHFKKTLKNHTKLWKMGIRCPLWSTATTKSDFLWDNSSEYKYLFKIITRNSLIVLFLKSNHCTVITENTC